MHTLRRQGYRNARVVMDMLYIGNRLVNPADVPTEEPQPQSGFSAEPDFRPNMGPQFRTPVPQQQRPQFRPQGPQFRPQVRPTGFRSEGPNHDCQTNNS